MSNNKCEHNNHSHIMLWIAIFWLTFSAMDCYGDKARMENQIRDLQHKVSQLENAK